MVSIGNDPQMAARFRLVKYDNLPRINPSIHWYVDLWNWLSEQAIPTACRLQAKRRLTLKELEARNVNPTSKLRLGDLGGTVAKELWIMGVYIPYEIWLGT